MARAPKTIDEYIRPFPPAVRQDGMLVYFAGFKKHIGLFPPVRGNAGLEKAVAKYAGPKGNLRFPTDQPIPFGLIARITKHQIRQVRAKAAARRKRT